MGSCNFTLLKLTCRTSSKMKIIILLVCATLVVTITSYPVKEDTTTTEPEISTVYDFCKAICDAGGCGAPLCDCGCPPLHRVFGINFHNNNNVPMIDTTTITTTKKPITTTTIPTTTTTTTKQPITTTTIPTTTTNKTI